MRLKITILILFLFIKISLLNAQCGVWKAKPIFYTEWKTIDTIENVNKNLVYTKLEMTPNLNEIGPFYSCSFNYPTRWVEYRLYRNGVLQQRFMIKEWFYVPNEKDIYLIMLNSVDDE